MRDQKSNRSVLITGMGSLNSVSENVEGFRDALYNGRCGITKSSEENGQISFGAFIKELDFRGHIDRLDVSDELKKKAVSLGRRAPEGIKYSILTSLEAWAQAGMEEREIDNTRIGIILAGSNLSLNEQLRIASDFADQPEFISPSYAFRFMDTYHIGVISELLSVKGFGFSLGSASASGNSAIIQGYNLIKYGGCDVCLVLGAAADLSCIEKHAFANLGALGGKDASIPAGSVYRPFDKNHDGFIYGQGAGCIVLEASDTVEKADALAELAGGSIVLDGNHGPECDPDGEARAMRAAIETAGIEGEEIDYINAHGTGSPLGDESEVRAIREVFGRHAADIRINSTKSIIGHCLFSAGVCECISTVIQMRGGFVHPNINLNAPIDQGLDFVMGKSSEQRIMYALSNSFGFGGFNTSIVLKALEG
ncbi:beta-ketoacyl synthase N-terminal-like domain-containing protein [uncultured Ruminococcus sp.]|uniref:beta-ketoacyl synthase N-terminal-like domain-containing protein n=1 Tax=uncultured Ruminococcus sp. TaxID=165186 RepID=UPI002610C8E2|nr:beta-ketoacyl synthase N-terminal-like domain-containing protein [uncultured Ruminococcus sp.]